MRAPYYSLLVPFVLASCQFSAPGVPGGSPAGGSDASQPDPVVDGAPGPGTDARIDQFDAAAPADAAGSLRKRIEAYAVDFGDINIDGVIGSDEWDSAVWLEISAPADYIDEGPTEMPDRSDIRARFAVQYVPGQAVYLAVEVIDDVHTNTGYGLADFFNGDSVQIGLDMANNGGDNYDNIDDYEYGWAVTSPPRTQLIYRWHSPSGAGVPTNMNYEVVRDDQRSETSYEIELTLDHLGDSANLQRNREFGFSIMVNDNDKANPGLPRDGYIQWTDGLGSSLKRPALFGFVKLTDGD